MQEEKQIDLKVWKGLDWYYEYAEAGFNKVPGSTIILTIGIVVGLVLFSLLMVPCFILGVMFGKEERQPAIGPVFDNDR